MRENSSIYAALLLKEWVKLKWVLLVVGVVNLGIIIKIALKMRSIFEFSKPVEVLDKVSQ